MMLLRFKRYTILVCHTRKAAGLMDCMTMPLYDQQPRQTMPSRLGVPSNWCLCLQCMTALQAVLVRCDRPYFQKGFEEEEEEVCMLWPAN